MLYTALTFLNSLSLTSLKYVLEMYLVPCRVVRSFKGMGLKVLLFTEEEVFEWTLEDVYKFSRWEQERVMKAKAHAALSFLVSSSVRG